MLENTTSAIAAEFRVVDQIENKPDPDRVAALLAARTGEGVGDDGLLESDGEEDDGDKRVLRDFLTGDNEGLFTVMYWVCLIDKLGSCDRYTNKVLTRRMKDVCLIEREVQATWGSHTT